MACSRLTQLRLSRDAISTHIGVILYSTLTPRLDRGLHETSAWPGSRIEQGTNDKKKKKSGFLE